jgi:hypothetical protein
MRNFAWACLGVLVIAGCGRSSNHPATFVVTGTVTLGGKPVEGGIITFRPAEDQYPANGITDADGRYELTTFSIGDGAMAGRYRVIMMKFEETTRKGGSGSPEEYVPLVGPTPAPKNLLPAKYADATKSGLTVEVQPEQSNSFDFELE